jgi:hypothetical protein
VRVKAIVSTIAARLRARWFLGAVIAFTAVARRCWSAVGAGCPG